MEKKLIRVPYTEKRLQFLDAALPNLVLQDGTVVYNFDYFVTPQAMFIRKMDEFDKPVVPFKLWNFKGEDVSSYFNHITELEYNEATVYAAAIEVYPEENEEFWLDTVKQHFETLMAMDAEICDAREGIMGKFAEDKAEQDRRQNLLTDIANRTAGDEDALPSPEVMQMRQEAAQKMLDETFGSNTETTDSGIIYEKKEITVETPKIITSSVENTPTKLVL